MTTLEEKKFINYRRLYFLILAVTTIGAVSWLSQTFMYADDYAYSYSCPEPPADRTADFWNCIGSPLTSWSQVWPSMVNHFEWVNGRLPNLLMFPAMMLPRWVATGLSGLLIALTLWLMLRLTRGPGSPPVRSQRELWLAVAMLWLGLPWYNYMQSVAYQFNYIPSGVLFLFTVYVSRKIGRLSSWQTAGACLLAFVAGWWHEGFAIPLVAWLAVAALITSGRRRERKLLMAVSAAASVALIMASGTSLRLAGEGFNTWKVTYILTRMLSELWPVWVAIAACILAVRRHGRARSTELLLRSLPSAVAIVISVTMAVLLGMHGRVLWVAQMLGIVLTLRFVRFYIGHVTPTKVGVVVSCILLALYAAWFVAVSMEQHRVSSQEMAAYEAAVAESASERESLIFVDLDHNEIPFWTLGLVNNRGYRTWGTLMANYHRLRCSFLAHMPSHLAGKPYNMMDTMPGNAGLRGRWPDMLGEVKKDAPLVRNSDGYAYEVVRRVRLGHDAPAFTPINRIWLKMRRMLGKEAEYVDLKMYIHPVIYRGEELGVYVAEPMPRWADHRDVVAIDTIPY